MTKEELITIIKGILKTDTDLSFLAQLEKSELETLIARIRERVDQVSKYPFCCLPESFSTEFRRTLNP